MRSVVQNLLPGLFSQETHHISIRACYPVDILGYRSEAKRIAMSVAHIIGSQHSFRACDINYFRFP